MTDVDWWPARTFYLVGRTGTRRDDVPIRERTLPDAIAFAEYSGNVGEWSPDLAPDGEIVIVEAVTTYRLVPEEELAARVPGQRGKKVPE